MKLNSLYLVTLFFSVTLFAQKKNKKPIEVKKAETSITIDGFGDDSAWYKAEWHPIDQVWEGKKVKEDDFSGRYKLLWDETSLYVLVEINDDKVIDITRDPLVDYYKDDSIMIGIDEDNSGGEHLSSYNAFTYHISLSGDVVDLNEAKQPRRYNHHIKSARNQSGTKNIWEMQVFVFKSSYNDRKENRPVKLKPNKQIGFTIGYNDMDVGQERDNLIGSEYVPGKDKNVAYKDADVFGTVLLIN